MNLKINKENDAFKNDLYSLNNRIKLLQNNGNKLTSTVLEKDEKILNCENKIKEKDLVIYELKTTIE